VKIRLLNQYFSLQEIWKLRRSWLSAAFSVRKLLNLVGLRVAVARRSVRVSPTPAVVMVEPSSSCDMACPMCPVVLNRTHRARVCLDFGVFEKLIEEIGKELVLATFWNFGEPLLNPDLFRMIRRAKEARIFCALSSNLLSLTPARTEEMLDSGLDYLIVSFDGASEETYEKFRGKGNYRRVVENLQHLLKRKAERGAALPFVNLQFIVMKENQHEVSAIRAFAREKGVDKLSLKKFTYVSESTRHFLPDNPDYVLGKYKRGQAPEFCSRPWTSTVLSADGEIVPCCGDLDFQCRFGNLAEPGLRFRDIWNGQKYRNFRAAVARGLDAIPMCRTCPSTDFTTDMFIE